MSRVAPDRTSHPREQVLEYIDGLLRHNFPVMITEERDVSLATDVFLASQLLADVAAHYRPWCAKDLALCSRGELVQWKPPNFDSMSIDGWEEMLHFKRAGIAMSVAMSALELDHLRGRAGLMHFVEHLPPGFPHSGGPLVKIGLDVGRVKICDNLEGGKGGFSSEHCSQSEAEIMYKRLIPYS